MGRHGRPERVRRAQMTAFRAAAAVGVAGTLAFAVQSVGKDVVVQAQSDSPYEPSHDSAGHGTTHNDNGSQAKTPGSHNGMATSFSAAPKVLHPVKHVVSGAAASVGNLQGSAIPHPSATTATPQLPGAPVAGSGGTSSSGGSTTQQQPPAQDQPPADSGSSSQDGGSTGSTSQSGGGTLTGVVGGVVGGVTNTLGGLLGG